VQLGGLPLAVLVHVIQFAAAFAWFRCHGLTSSCSGGVVAGPAWPALAAGVALQPGGAVEHQPDVEVLARELALDLLADKVKR
jgi:hypothetical protein